jgi:hypothetical protein
LPHEFCFAVVDEQTSGQTVLAWHVPVSIGRPSMHDMALAGSLELATPEPVSKYGPLILGNRSLDLQQ